MNENKVLFKDRSGIAGSWKKDDGNWEFYDDNSQWWGSEEDIKHILSELETIKKETQEKQNAKDN